MAGYATTKLSSRGQVVIPEEIRITLGLSEGDEFVVRRRRRSDPQGHYPT